MDIRMGQQSGLDTLKELRQMNPKQVVIMMTAYGTSQTAIEAMKLGAYDYVLKPFDIPQLKDLLFEALAAAARDEADRRLSRPSSTPRKARQTIVGNSPAMQQVYKLIGQVAPTNTTILITGESGTGKELVARAIYQNGSRAEQAVHRHQLRRHSRKTCSKANSSATRRARSPARSRSASASSSSATAARFSSTKSATCR